MKPRNTISRFLNKLREVVATRNLRRFASELKLAELPVPKDSYPMSSISLHEMFVDVERKRPRLIVELGSGCSTVLLAAYARAHQIKLVSVESSPKYLGETLRLLEEAAVTGPHVTVVEAGLKSYSIKGNAFLWYDVDAMNLNDGSVDYLVVDGPPGGLQKNSRYPAMQLLWQKLAPEARILLDDANRPDELEICRDWIEEFPDLSLELNITGRGIARFEKSRVAGRH